MMNSASGTVLLKNIVLLISKIGFMPGVLTGIELHKMNASPLQMIQVAMVAMMAGSFSAATMKVLIAPRIRPRTITMSSAIQTFTPPRTKIAKDTALSAIMPPTDRSMAPLLITNVIAQPINTTGKICRATLTKLRTEKKRGFIQEKKITSRISIASRIRLLTVLRFRRIEPDAFMSLPREG